MSEQKPKRESLILNLLFNLVLPILILTKLSPMIEKRWGESAIDPTIVLIVALGFPLGYGIYDYITRKIFNILSILGFSHVLATGVIGVLELDGIWIAVKEAAFPALIGICIFGSMKSSNPLVKLFLYNDQVLNVSLIEKELAARSNRDAFEKLLNVSTYILVASFALSAVLNFILAKTIVTSPGGTQEFNEQIGKMTGLSWIVIVVPTMILMVIALWRLLSGTMKLTGLEFEALVHAPEPKSKDS